MSMRAAAIAFALLAMLLPYRVGANTLVPNADEELPALFEQLREAPTVEHAARAEVRIWQSWMRHDDIDINRQFQLGVELMQSGDLPAAVKQFSTVLELAPGFSEAWNKRATVHYMMQNLSASVADIEQTLALEPRHFGALSGLGLIFLARGDLPGALAAFEKVLVIHPHSPSAQFHVQQLRRTIQEKSI